MDLRAIDGFWRGLPPSVDGAALRRAWLALTPDYAVDRWRLPLPVWARRQYDDSGVRAWETLGRDLAGAGAARPFCIYLHVPFCSSKCGFCDSYSFTLGAHQAERLDAYVDRLCYELRLWSALPGLRRRPVSTVHLGGGTPTFLGAARLARLAACCRECFATSDATEWALESTVAELTPEVQAALHALGYRRLHLGVQSLEDDVRAVIGRRRPAAAVLAAVEAALALDWVVSVDLICGLPGQTPGGFVTGLERVIAAGVDGVSLYELLIYAQNRRWAEAHGLARGDHTPNFLLFQAGAGVLAAHGFRPNLFNHWAGPRDANVYFTFPTRGEDCLAVGTIADGVFGDYHYRHPRYGRYLRTAPAGAPGLEGGLRRNTFENALHPLVTAILSGAVPAELFALVPDAVTATLIERWLESGLVQLDDDAVRLTGSGAWFAGNLIADLVAEMTDGIPGA